MSIEVRNHPDFWHYLEQLVAESEIVIDRPRGSVHPRMEEIIYPLDYGYLEGTTGGDGEGIDVWVGNRPEKSVDGIACTVDLFKRDAELKILLGCYAHEMEMIRFFLNKGDLRCVVLRRER